MRAMQACVSSVSPPAAAATASAVMSGPCTSPRVSNIRPSSLEVNPHRGVRIQCRSSGRSKAPGPSSGDNESKAVLDAFFLGKAFAEALNERIGSTVGEFLSVIGQWQAEQQKQVQDFQEEVLERAKRAKEKAALEIIEEQGGVPKGLSTPSDGAGPIVSPPTVPAPPSLAEDTLTEIPKD